MMNSWIRFSDTGWQVGWIRKTSLPRTDSAILTSYSPSLKRVTLISPTGISSSPAMARASSGLAFPDSSFSSPNI